MRVEGLMTKDVITVGPDAPLKEAARRMITAGISGLPVVDDGKLVGVITEADFVKTEAGRRAAKRARLLRWFVPDDGIPSAERRVGDVMTHDVVTVSPESDHTEAARLMRKVGIKRLPVVVDDEVVGLVSRGDIMRVFARADDDIIHEIVSDVMQRVLWIDPGRVRVTCEDGNVILSGQLETRVDAELLAEFTRRVDGVASVQDRLTWRIDNTKLEMVPPLPGPL